MESLFQTVNRDRPDTRAAPITSSVEKEVMRRRMILPRGQQQGAAF
jgi:hypothetical protein